MIFNFLSEQPFQNFHIGKFVKYHQYQENHPSYQASPECWKEVWQVELKVIRCAGQVEDRFRCCGARNGSWVEALQEPGQHTPTKTRLFPHICPPVNLPLTSKPLCFLLVLLVATDILCGSWWVYLWLCKVQGYKKWVGQGRVKSRKKSYEAWYKKGE